MPHLTNSGFTIKPNPAHGFVQLEYDADRATKVSYTVTNITGRMCLSGSFNALHGRNSEPIDVADLPTGLYFVKLAGEFGVAEQKLVINQ